MTVAETFTLVARRLAAYTVDKDTARQQVRVILAQAAKADAASIALDLAVALVAAEARAAKLAKDLKCERETQA